MSNEKDTLKKKAEKKSMLRYIIGLCFVAALVVTILGCSLYASKYHVLPWSTFLLFFTVSCILSSPYGYYAYTRYCKDVYGLNT